MIPHRRGRLAYFKGIPKWCFSQVFCWRLGVPKPKTNYVPENVWCVGLAAFGGEAKKTIIVLKMFGLLALVSQASKKRLGQKNTPGSL